jgi:hypothetical protein
MQDVWQVLGRRKAKNCKEGEVEGVRKGIRDRANSGKWL